MGEIILMVVAVAIALGVVAYFGKKRSQAIEKAAAEMGFRYEKDGKAFLAELDKNLHLLNQGVVKSPRNVMRGANGVTIFDYQFQRRGVGYGARAINQTVVAFRFPSGTVPNLSLGPERLWQKAASAVGYKLIRFDSHPAFSKRFAVRGSDEPGIREFFSSALLEYCESWPEKPAWCLDAAGSWLLLYAPYRTIKPVDLRGFSDSTAAMFKEITSRAGLRTLSPKST